MSKEDMVKEAVEEAKAKAAKEQAEAEETVETEDAQGVEAEAKEATEEATETEGDSEAASEGKKKFFGKKEKKDKKDEKNAPFVEGMEKIYKQLMTTLESVGVKPIEAVGQEFNPDFHNAVMHIEDEGLGENIIAEEFQKGYMYRESVVRHSMVKVAN